jgi:hypothetical protein
VAYFDKQNTELQGNVAYLTQILEFKTGIQDARILIFKKDVLRSLLFTLLISGLVYAFAIKKLKANLLLLGVGALILIDLWAVDKRYLNNEQKGREYYNWTKKKEVSAPYRASYADNFILQAEVNNNPSIAKKIDEALVADPKNGSNAEDAEIIREKLSFRELNFATNYRVVTLQNPFANAEISNFHKSIGGYHGAKLKKYQELIDFYLNEELGTFIKTLQDSLTNSDSIDNLFKNKIPVLGMLNTKYLIYNPGANPLTNPYALGNCWFVNDIKFVDNADAEMLSLGNTNLRNTAIVRTSYKNEIGKYESDTTASIQMTEYLPNRIAYASKTKNPQFAVFSEVYYPKGWNAYIDGKQVPYINANYILRAMNIPAGEHTIEFRFEPQSYIVGNKIALASSILLVVLVIGMIGFEALKWAKK